MDMNILEQEDLVKGAPDNLLLQEAQSPSGQLPQFLVVSEIQRRKQMRDRFSAQEQQPEQTVSDQIIAEASPQMPPQGIGALQPQMQPQMPPQAPVAAMQPPEAMQQPSMPPEMMAAQMDAQSQMMAAAGGRMPYRRMAGGGMIPNALVEDQGKFKGSLDEIPEDQEGFLAPEDMGIPKIIRSRNQQEKVPLYERAKGFVSNLRDNAEIGDFKVRGDSLTARGNVKFPVFGNALDLGAKGYISTGSDGAGITELDASYAIPNKNLSFQGSYRPNDKSWQASFLKRFNQGGVVKMQQGQIVDPNVVDPNAAVEPPADPMAAPADPMAAPADPMAAPADPMAAYAAQQQNRYDELKKYIESTEASDRERAEKDMMSQALINIGAGIASGNIGSGLEKAGASVAATREAQLDRAQLRQLQLMKEMPGAAGAGGSRVQSTQILENGNIGLVMTDGTIIETNQKSLRTAGLKNIMVAGVPHRFDAVTGTLTPLGTQAGEIGFGTAKSQAEFEEDQRQERLTEAPRVANALFDAVTTTGNVDEAVDNAMEFLESNSTAGAVGGTLNWIPGTDMYALGITLDTLKANLGFDSLQQMREASPTGGALGQVSERELDLLVRAAGAIEQGLPPDILRERLEYLREDYKKIRDQAISSFIFHADSIDDEDVTKDYQRRIDLAERLAANPNASPGSRRSNQAAVDAWNDHLRRYGNVESISETDELNQIAIDLQGGS